MSGGGRSRLRPDDAAKLRDAAKIVGGGLIAYFAVQVAGEYLIERPSGAAAVQALIAELGAGWLAVAWSDPHAPMPTFESIAKRAAKGAAIGLAAAAVVFSFAAATHATTFAAGTPSAAQGLVVGLILAGLLAMRDELLLRGVVLRAFRQVAPAWALLLVCGLAGAAACYGVATRSGAPPAPRLAVAWGLEGAAFAALWLRDRGAWLAWSAHTAWGWATGPLARGGLFDARWQAGRWGGGDAGMQSSLAALIALAALTAAAALWALQRRQEKG